MKHRRITAAALCLLLLSGCGGKPVPLEELPADYSVQDAKKDGCVVSEDGMAASGQEVWADFYEQVSKGEAASVRLCGWFTLEGALEGLSSQTDEEYRASLEEKYPALTMTDLVFDGKTFTFTHYENGGLWGTEAYSLLRRFEFDEGLSPLSSQSRFKPDSPAACYVLTDDKDATFEQLFNSGLSAKWEDHIPFQIVYFESAETS